MKLKFFAGVFLLAVSLGSYFSFSKPQVRKASRALASIEEDFNFLSLRELKLLNENDQRNYLDKISETLVKASVFDGAFKGVTSSKTSLFSFGVPKAYAAIFCPVQGLHPPIRANSEDCEKDRAYALKVLPASKSLFASDQYVSHQNRGEVKGLATCPDGQSLCNPALIGFDFTADGKAKVRCLKSATNANCYKKLKTSGDQMKKSLAVLEKANPKFWDEFEEGIEKNCFNKKGEFNKNDEGCAYVKKQLNYSTSKYRSRLTQQYKDLAKKLEDQKNAELKNTDPKTGKVSNKACRRTAKNKLDRLDPENFNTPGFKIIYKRGQCWRVPYKALVRKKGKFYRVLPEESAGKSALFDFEESSPGKVKDTRFYNFKCGPCNSAKKLSSCLFNLRKPKEERKHTELADNKFELLGRDDCRALISSLENTELPDVVFEKASKQGKPFSDTDSIQ